MQRHVALVLGISSCVLVPSTHAHAASASATTPTPCDACQDLLTRAVDIVQAHQPQAAITLLRPALQPFADVPTHVHADARLIAARAALELHQPDAALRYLAADLMQLAPESTDYILLLEARAYEQRSQWSHALRAWEAFRSQHSRVGEWAEEALYKIAESHRMLNHQNDAERAYTHAMRAYPRSLRFAHAHMQLAAIYESQRAFHDAGEIYRDFVYRNPDDPNTPAATARLRQLHRTADVPMITRDDDLHAIDYLLRTHAFSQAETRIHEAAQHPWFQSSGEQSTLATRRAQLAFQQGHYDQAVIQWRALRNHAPNAAERLRYNRWIARSLVAAGHTEDAIQMYLDIVAQYRNNSIGREAMYKAAWTAHEAGAHARAVTLFRDYADRYAAPKRHARNKRQRQTQHSIMTDEIHWYIAWHTYRSGQVQDALQHLRQLRAQFPSSSLLARTHYWEGRLLQQLNRHDAARDAYRTTVRVAPDDYYGFLAQQRLSDLHRPWTPADNATNHAQSSSAASHTRLHHLLSDIDIQDPVAVIAEPDVQRTFQWDSELGLRAARFARIGLHGPAADAVRRLPTQVGSSARMITLTRARILSSLGDFHTAFQLASVTPSPDPTANQTEHPYWRLAYPKAYIQAVETAAQQFTVSEALILSIMRQESAFNHSARSAVHASGLMQLMPITAQRIAQAIGEQYDPMILTDPTHNVRFGAWYLSELVDKFHGNLALVISSYNAGPRIVSTWLKTHPGDDTDAFVEEIPFKETRHYVRKVLANLAAYSALYDGTSMHFHARLPPDRQDNIDF